VSIIT